MDENTKELIKKFIYIKSKEYIESKGVGASAAGRTFEELLGKKADNISMPDYHDIEIKTKLDFCKGNITLFNCTPLGENENEIKRLKEKYGYKDKYIPSEKNLQISVYNARLKAVNSGVLFTLKIDHTDGKVYLVVLNRSLEVIEKSVYWTFDMLKTRLYNKLKKLALIRVKRRVINGKMHYYYYRLELYTLKEFETFIELLEKNIIFVTFHIGIFRSGKRKGTTHDRGTAYEILEKDINQLYNKKYYS